MIQEPWYSISQVSQQTGLSTQLIRKWETRYALIQPMRLENGYRVYTKHDITVLSKVRVLVEAGHSVSNAIRALATMGGATESIAPTMPAMLLESAARSAFADILARLLAAGESGDDGATATILQRAELAHSLVHVLAHIIPPYLEQVGCAWESGRWNEYQEHLASCAVRDYLSRVRGRLVESARAPLILGSCLPDERHEIPLQLVLLAASLHGYRTSFLGASPAPGALEAAVERLRPVAVMVSAMTSVPFERDPQVLEKLAACAERHVDSMFFIGGRGVTPYTSEAASYPLLHFVSKSDEVFAILQGGRRHRERG